MGRRLLSILVAAAIVFAGVLWLRTRTPDPEPFGLEIVRFEIDSDLVPAPVDEIAVVPKAAATRPLLVFLHGRGSSPEDMLSEEMFAALEDLGAKGPIVLLPEGGEASYWHDREDGDWATHLLDEVIPTAERRFDLDSGPVAIGGISMGGFGALHLGLGNPRFCAVGAHSPALFRSWKDASEGSFDDVEDFERHDVLGTLERGTRAYASVPIWIDIGRDDPFEPVVSELIRELEAAGMSPTARIWPGEHEDGYWLDHMDEYLNFYATELDRCRIN